ncbi:type IV toxin-antitoxin system AbiEi family antitoxin [Paludibaculum fermentans]|uniref:type IV toxin-antitoxin system AbiEi family antitoxin n=1 Tax=Paludibaculum fermentans TaxID=1473598 RepID=UPI003EBFFA91
MKAVWAFESDATHALESVLAAIPIVTLQRIERNVMNGPHEFDIVVHLTAAGQPHLLACEVKQNGQPRYVREGLLRLKNILQRAGLQATPVFIAPYLSPEARMICQENQVGYVDLQGNVRLEFDGVFIERIVADKPAPDRRELKSLFRPKSALVLKTLLHDPHRRWRVEELAQSAGVSLGHASNVGSGLLDREWADRSAQGLFLAKPNELLDAWRDAYEAPPGKRLSFYTILHGKLFEEAARATLRTPALNARAVFASFSAAQWLAPYGRTGMQYFYADEAGLERLKTALQLSISGRGENVTVTIPKDRGLLEDTVEPAPGALCTSAVQTYLDLCVAGERGREAADHLRREKLQWAQ